MHSLPMSMVKPFTLVSAAVLALFRDAGVEGTFVLLDEGRGELRGHNRERAEQRLSPASTFKVANALIGLSVGAVQNVDEVFPTPAGLTRSCASGLIPWGCAGR